MKPDVVEQPFGTKVGPQLPSGSPSDRAPIELNIDYQRLNTFFADYTHNISRGGTFIETARPLPIGTEFRFTLRLPGIAEPIFLQGRVHWILRREDCKPNQEPGMGVGFVFDSEVHRQRLIAQVEKLMIEHLGPLLYEQLVGKHLTGMG